MKKISKKVIDNGTEATSNKSSPLAEVFARAVQGDPEALSSILRRFEPWVLKIVRGMVRGYPEDVHDDVHAVVMEDLMLSLPGNACITNGESPQRWVEKIVRDSVRRYLKKEQRRTARVFLASDTPFWDHLPDQSTPQDIQTYLNWEKSLLDLWIDRQKPQDRKLLKLVLEGCGPDEVAAELGISYDAARKRFARLTNKAIEEIRGLASGGEDGETKVPKRRI